MTFGPDKSLYTVAGQNVYRFNADGTVDSFCRQCFATVANSDREPNLEDPERNHVCEPGTELRFELLQGLRRPPQSS